MNVRGHRIHVERWPGDGVPVGMVHSTGLGAFQWLRVVRTLRTRPRWAPDLVGYGHSDGPVGGTKDWTVDLAAVEQLVLEADGQTDLVGHSYGGRLVLEVALRHPGRVRRVVVHEPVLWGSLYSGGPADLVDTFRARIGRLEVVARGGEDWLRGFVDFWNGPGGWASLPESRRADWRHRGPVLAEEVHALLEDTRGHTDWAGLQVPVQVCMGADTAEVEKVVCRLLAEQAPCGSLKLVPGGHMAPLTHGRSFCEAVAGFLEAP